MKLKKISIFCLALITAAMTACSCSDKSGSSIPVENIELSRVSAYAFVGDEIHLEAILTPANATDKVKWSSSDETVASVDSTGTVMTHAEGSASIYAIAGSVYAQCDITSVTVNAGQYYCNDGTLSDEYDAEKAIALVFYSGHHPNDLSDYSNTGIGHEKCHGYAVALHDAVDQWVVWGPYEILGCYPKDENGNALDNFTGNTSDTDWSGYLYTTMIKDAAGKYEGLWTGGMDGYAACYYAVNYEQSVPAPATSSGWFLPAGSQLWSIYEHIDLLYRVEEHQFVENDWYWSSSEFWEIPERGVNFLNLQTSSIEGLDKTGGNLVRSVIAF